MAIKPILKNPDPILRRKTKKVPSIDKSIIKLIGDMTDTLDDAEGVGLAAPQVGVSLSIVVIHIPDEVPFALINPEVIRRTGEREVVEGCLSIPGYQGKIKRSVSVTVKGLDAQGKLMRIKADGLLAQALEHEIDHLEGILYIDRLESRNKLYKLDPVEQAEDSLDDAS
jgi:peptide deformylase